MASVVSTLFISLDGVVEIDPEWHFPYFDDHMAAAVTEDYRDVDVLVLGRVTYDSFAGAWPGREQAGAGRAARPGGVRRRERPAHRLRGLNAGARPPARHGTSGTPASGFVRERPVASLSTTYFTSTCGSRALNLSLGAPMTSWNPSPRHAPIARPVNRASALMSASSRNTGA